MPIINIYKGWKSYLQGETSELAKQRAKACKPCKHAVIGTIAELMPDFKLNEIQGLKCDLCDCPLSAKLRSPKEKCKRNKW